MPGSVTVEHLGDQVRAHAQLPGVSAAQVMSAFVDADQVSQWWGGELQVEPWPGGCYAVHFRQQGRTMRGRIVHYRPDGTLTFTWNWEHLPDRPARQVEVRATELTDGTELQLVHGTYGDDEDERADADSHRAGWVHFLPRLVSSLLS
ncbi:MAG: SRPBCC domain-containing protein, partial [Sporichthyaceae bacterium]|nr:SRPBCC domain-containing protein [Sporichthyaceae bacterium]